jgi:pilus assembly protein CpaB
LDEIMRTKPLVTILFVGSLVVAAVAGTHILSQKGAGGPKAYILATTMPLSQGTLLRAQDVTWQGVTETKPGAITRPSATALEARPELDNETRASVYGAVVRRALDAGEPILQAAIVKPGDREFLQVVLTPGARAIAIPVATGGASTGLLAAGDRVDVVLTQNFKNDTAPDMRTTPVTRRSVSETVVDNLRVLAIDAPDTVTATPGRPMTPVNPATGNFGRTVTLEVTPEQAEQVNVAAELGKLSLTLRSATDNLASASPTMPIVRVANNNGVNHNPVDGRIKATWAGDVSPALSGAAQERPVAVVAPSVTIFRGTKPPRDREPQTEIVEDGSKLPLRSN